MRFLVPFLVACSSQPARPTTVANTPPPSAPTAEPLRIDPDHLESERVRPVERAPIIPPTGPLASREIARVVGEAMEEISICYDAEVRAGVEIGAPAKVTFTIDGQGRPRDVVTSGISTAFETCISALFEGLTFRATGTATGVTYPLTFRRA